MRLSVLVVSIGLSLLLAAPAAAGVVVVPEVRDVSDFQRLILIEVRTGSGRASSPLNGFSLDFLATDRGQVVLDHARPFKLEFKETQTGLALELSDPRDQAMLALTLYRGEHEVGRQVFAHRTLPGSRVALIRDGRIAVASEQPFDRIELRRIDPAPDAPPLEVGSLFLLSEEFSSLALAEQRGNLGALLCVLPLGIAYNFAFGYALVPSPEAYFVGWAAFAANLALKFCKPSLFAPPDVERTVPAGQCEIELDQPHMAFGYSDALGVPLSTQSGWGELGTPIMLHHNTDVDVMLLAGNPGPPTAKFTDLDFFLSTGSYDASDKIWESCRDDGSVRFSQFEGSGPLYECPYVEDRVLTFPVGHNTVVWRANPRVSPVDFVPPFPGLPPGSKLEPYAEILLNIWIETFLIVGDAFINGWRLPNANFDYQSVTVFDEIPPTITPMPGSEGNAMATVVGGVLHVTIEADEVGGVSRRRYEDVLRSFLQVSDACDRPTTLNISYPTEALRSFWPISTDSEDNAFFVTWTARDPGPNLGGNPNETITSMRIEVLDRQPPSLVPPPDIVEIDTQQVSDLGQPAVFDLVDLSPQVSNDALLPLGIGLHEVIWTATDSAGNSSTATQIVNVKASNIPPVALAQTGPGRPDAVSFEPMPIRLQGNDPDGDPLRFKIEDRPENGFFIAPLYPYFIEDFRIEQSISDSELLALCNNGEGGERRFDLEFPSDPGFLTVTDDGRTFVVDRGSIKCLISAPNPSDRVQRQGRVAVFANDGSLLNSRHIQANQLRDVVLDPVRERIFLTSHSSGPSFVGVLDLELQTQVGYNLQNMTNRDGATSFCYLEPSGSCTLEWAHSSVVDDNGLIYVMNRTGSINVLDGTLPPDWDCSIDCSHTPTVVGVLNDDGQGGEGSGRALALDKQGRLYAARRDRIFRYSPSYVAEDGLAYPGSLDGWLGRCDIDLAPGDQAVCDVANHRSLGFSCTDEICGVHLDFNPGEQAICGPLGIGGQPRWGCRPGQFVATPRDLDIAPDGTIYVADFSNSRIQRFSLDGFFAGQAKSTGAGSGFVIGDFGNPENISVNSSRFYILDPSTNLLHISLLTPFVEIGDDYADLIYQSNNQFACENSADCIDRFSFRVSDGVRDPVTGQPEVSAPAEVEVEVSRNFRAPFANPGISVLVMEDQPTPVPLDGSDPDPLDTLVFDIIDEPAKGSVFINGQNAAYFPAPDAWGADSFSFTVSDGVFTSSPETVQVEIIEINDAPIISIPQQTVEGGTGFRVQLDLAFRDPDPDESHTVVIDWGDGTIEPEGEFDADGIPTGPILAHGGTDSGRITAEHIFLTAGEKSVEVCVTDRMQPGPGETEIPTPGLSLTACEDIAFSIADGIDLALTAQPSADVALPEQFISYQFQVENRQPDAGPGLTATGIQLAIRLSPNFDPSSITTPAGCSRNGFRLDCSVTNLSPGQSDSFNVTAQVATDTPSGRLLVTEAEAVLDQIPIYPQLSLLLTTPVSRPADFQVGATGDALRDLPDANPGDGICASADGVCTLRAAIEEAGASATPKVIALANGFYLLDEGLEFQGNIVLIGNGPDQTRIHGPRHQTLTGSSLRLENLTLSGGGLTAAPIDSLTVRRVRFTGNDNPSSFGGGIQTSAAALDIRDTTFDNNRAIDGGSLMCFSCSGILENVTVTGGNGGGLTFTGSGQVALRHLTIVDTGGGSGWGAPNGAALHIYDNMNATIANSVVAGNYSTGPAKNCAVGSNASLASQGNNAFGDLTNCAASLQASDLSITNARLQPLAAGLDGLPVRLPKADSPLIDAFLDASCLATDARGLTRPRDGNDDGIAWCDIGAVERRTNRIFRDRFGF